MIDFSDLKFLKVIPKLDISPLFCGKITYAWSPYLPGLINTPGGNFAKGLRFLLIGILRLGFESIDLDSDNFVLLLPAFWFRICKETEKYRFNQNKTENPIFSKARAFGHLSVLSVLSVL